MYKISLINFDFWYSSKWHISKINKQRYVLAVLIHLAWHFAPCLYRIYRTIRRSYNPLFFSKVESAPYSPVLLMCGSGCTLSPSSEQILCCNNRYQRNSTSLNSFFFESKLLFFLAIKLPALISPTSLFFLFTCSHSLHKCIFLFTLRT